MIYVGIN